MNIGNALINSLIVSGLILVAAMIFGIKGEKSQPAHGRSARRTKRRANAAARAQARVRVAASAGR